MGHINYEALVRERASERDKIALHHQGRRLEEIARNLETMHELALAQARAAAKKSDPGSAESAQDPDADDNNTEAAGPSSPAERKPE